jgi:hypothetical protein
MVGLGGSLPSGTVGRSVSRVAARAACSTSMKESVRSLAS